MPSASADTAGDAHEVGPEDGADGRRPDHDRQVAPTVPVLGKVGRGIPRLVVGCGGAAEEDAAGQQQREGAHDAGGGEEDRAGDAEQVAETQPRAAAADGHDAGHRDRDQRAAEDLERATETGQVRRAAGSARPGASRPRCRSRRPLPQASGSRRACRWCGAGRRGRQAWRRREEAPTQYAVGWPSAGRVHCAPARPPPRGSGDAGEGAVWCSRGRLRGRRPGGPPSSCRPW